MALGYGQPPAQSNSNPGATLGVDSQWSPKGSYVTAGAANAINYRDVVALYHIKQSNEDGTFNPYKDHDKGSWKDDTGLNCYSSSCNKLSAYYPPRSNALGQAWKIMPDPSSGKVCGDAVHTLDEFHFEVMNTAKAYDGTRYISCDAQKCRYIEDGTTGTTFTAYIFDDDQQCHYDDEGNGYKFIGGYDGHCVSSGSVEKFHYSDTMNDPTQRQANFFFDPKGVPNPHTYSCTVYAEPGYGACTDNANVAGCGWCGNFK